MERNEGERRTRAAVEPQAPGAPRVTLGTFRCTDRARQNVNTALDTGRLTYGPFSREFEQRFAEIHGADFAVLSNSGTSALHMALAAMKELHGWDDGDEVVVPAVTFVATANIVLHCRMRPVFVDVDPHHYDLDPEGFARAITPRTRAVIPVHLFGQPADMTAIGAIARGHGIKVIEDSCETMFAGHRGAMCGSLGDIGCFSTYVAHLIVTGVGGINTTSDPEYAVLLRSLANHGRDSIYISIDDDKGVAGDHRREVIAKRFRFTSIGFSNRITELEAAIGCAALDDWQDMIRRRRDNARVLTAHLSPLAGRLQLPSVREGSEHSFMMFPIVLREESKRGLVEHLEWRGIETRDMLPLTNQPALQREAGVREDDHPVARWINESGFYVGCHQDLDTADMEYLAHEIAVFLRSA